MIKLFRNIRQNLINEGKTKRYLKYAIGEIILVVIGILIALQINNWNENRKNLSLIRTEIDALVNDLEKNSQEATRVMELNYARDTIYHLVLDDLATRELYLKDIRFSDLLTNWNLPIRNEETLSKILQNGYLGSKHNSLLPYIKLYKSIITEEKNIERNVQDNVLEEMKFLSNNYTWIRAKNTKDINRAINYFLSDTIYKNRVQLSQDKVMDNYSRRILARRNVEIGLLNRIKKINEGISTLETEKLFYQHKLVPFDLVECETTDFKMSNNILGFKNSFLLINESYKSAILYALNDSGERIRQFTLEPGEFMPSYFLGDAHHYVGMGFEWGDENNCFQKYRAAKDGYLLIK